MIIEVPDWCVIGKFIEFQIYDPMTNKIVWYKDKIVSYGVDGFFHQGYCCPVYYNKFEDYGKSVRECE